MQHSNVINFPGVYGNRHASTSTQPADRSDSSAGKRAPTRPELRTPQSELTRAEVLDCIESGRIEVHYQPQFDLGTGDTVAAEALVRLVDSDGRLAYPDRFIEMVEQGDLVVPFGRAVIERVCEELASVRSAGQAIERVAINLSARQLNLDTGLVAFVDRTLAAYGLGYDDLEFELTERQALTPLSAGLATIDALAARGGRIVIDDFGVGYSSFAYLTELPISGFKLDRALIARVLDDHRARAAVRSLLMLATDLRLDVVAEGIETDEQRDYLRRAGCPLAQGYGYARPMPMRKLLDNLPRLNSVSVQDGGSPA